MLARMQRKGNSGTLAAGMQISTAIMGNSMEFPQTISNRMTIGLRNPTNGTIAKGNELSTSTKCLYFHVN